ALDIHFDSVRAGIETVLDQLLDDRGGALDHFAGGDLIDQLARENSDGHDRQSIAPERAVKRSWPERRESVHGGSRIAFPAISVWPGTFYVPLLSSVRR